MSTKQKLTQHQIKGRKEAFKLVSKAKADPKDLEKILNDYELPITITAVSHNLFTKCCNSTSNLNMLKWLYENGLNNQKIIDVGFYYFITDSKNKTMFDEIFDWFDDIGARFENEDPYYHGTDTIVEKYKCDIKYLRVVRKFVKFIYQYYYHKHKIKKTANYIEKYYDLNKKTGIYNFQFIHWIIILMKKFYGYNRAIEIFKYIDKTKSNLCCFDSNINFEALDINGNTYLHLCFVNITDTTINEHINQYKCYWYYNDIYIHNKKLLDIKNNDGYTPLMLMEKELKILIQKGRTVDKQLIKKILKKLRYDTEKDENKYFS